MLAHGIGFGCKDWATTKVQAKGQNGMCIDQLNKALFNIETHSILNSLNEGGLNEMNRNFMSQL